MSFFIFYIFLMIAFNPHLVNAKKGLVTNVFDKLGNVGKMLCKSADKVGIQAMEFYLTVIEAIKDECELKYPTGMKLVQRQSHIHRVKGCGYIPFEHYDEGLAQCCEAHNICYETCGIDKYVCDKTFRKCLFNVCEKYRDGSFNVLVKGCKIAAHTVFTGSVALGCRSFKDAQSEACVCRPKDANDL